MTYAILLVPCLICTPIGIVILVATRNVGLTVGAATLVTLVLAIIFYESIIRAIVAMSGVAISLLKARIQPMKPLPATSA